MKGYEIKFNIYAETEEEAEVLRREIIRFIDFHAQNGRAVTADKLSKAIGSWESNAFIRNRIIEYFK